MNNQPKIVAMESGSNERASRRHLLQCVGSAATAVLLAVTLGGCNASGSNSSNANTAPSVSSGEILPHREVTNPTELIGSYRLASATWIDMRNNEHECHIPDDDPFALVSADGASLYCTYENGSQSMKSDINHMEIFQLPALAEKKNRVAVAFNLGQSRADPNETLYDFQGSRCKDNEMFRVTSDSWEEWSQKEKYAPKSDSDVAGASIMLTPDGMLYGAFNAYVHSDDGGNTIIMTPVHQRMNVFGGAGTKELVYKRVEPEILYHQK